MRTAILLTFTLLVVGRPAAATSHRESPSVAARPQIDGTDFYVFRSYEASRQGYVTFIADYNPLEEPGAAPLYYSLDPLATYDIHISNNGDAVEDLTFRFRFNQLLANLAYNIGPAGAKLAIPAPGAIAGPFGAGDTSMVNIRQPYWVQVIRGPVDSGATIGFLAGSDMGSAQFEMPLANIGSKSVADYEAYARQHVYEVTIPGCGQTGRLFAGPRKDPFGGNLRSLRDLLNLPSMTGPSDAYVSDTAGKNVIALALEVPIACVVEPGRNVIAAWTIARIPRNRFLEDEPTFNDPDIQNGPRTPVSRVSNPLVNELLIGMSKKDNYNASAPAQDGQFLNYFNYPALPELLQTSFPALRAPDRFPRTDMVQVFLTGIAGLNADGSQNVETLRLNTAVPPAAAAQQNRLGHVGGDNAGWPNGRRPGDDVVDIFLRVVMGFYLNPVEAPSGQSAFSDGTLVNATMFDEAFPYLKTPLPGSQ